MLPLPDGIKISHLAWRQVRVELRGDLSRATRQYEEIIHYTAMHRGRVLLSQVEGEASSGQLLAVLGGSGCGKTLLLRTLAGRPLSGKEFIFTGSVALNGGRFRRSPIWHRRIGFVQRSDHLYPKLTVRETLSYAHELKNSQAGGNPQMVDEWLHLWGLNRVAGRFVDEIENEMSSIGHRKRTAIAIHTINQPDVLFLDEPTLGLDPRREEELIRDLHAYATEKQVIVIVALNPSRSAVFAFFSRILLLCHGQTVFYGRVEDAFWYFDRAVGISMDERKGPADYFTDLITVPNGNHEQLDALRRALSTKWDEWRHVFLRDLIPIDGVNAATSVESLPWPNSRWRELKILLGREFRELSRDYPPITYNIIQRLLVFTLLSFLYFQVDSYPLRYAFRVRFGLLIFIPVNQSTLVLALTVPSMACIRPMLQRERIALTYRLVSFYAARVLSEFPVNFLPVIAYAFIIYPVTGLRAGVDHFLVFLGVLLFQVYCVMGLGFAVSCVAENRRIRDLLTMLIFLTMFMFGGYQIQNRLNVTWILLWMQYLSPIFYAYVALIRNEFEGNTSIGGSGIGSDVLREYRAMPFSIWAAMGALLGWGTFYFLLGYLALRRNTRPQLYLF